MRIYTPIWSQNSMSRCLFRVQSCLPGVSPEHPGTDRMAEGGGEAPRVGGDDPYVDN